MGLLKLRRRKIGGEGVDSAYDNLDMSREDYLPREDGLTLDVPGFAQEQYSMDEFNEHVSGIPAVPDEFNSHRATDEEEEVKRHNRLKQQILRPVAATFIGLAAIFASFGIDFLGEDFLLNGSSGFPTLPNPNPDWEGEYAWSRLDEYLGPELFIRYSAETADGYENGYLVQGGAWAQLDSDIPVTDGTKDGSLRYDKAANTLYLNNFKGSLIETNEMGNAFKIHLTGENHVDFIEIWGAGHSGSVTFTGEGSLTIGRIVDEADGTEQFYEGGLILLGEWGIKREYGSACLMVDSGVTLEIYGSPAISIEQTAMEKAVYYRSPLTLKGGTLYTSASHDKDDPESESGKDEPVCYFVTVVDDEGQPSNHVIFAP